MPGHRLFTQRRGDPLARGVRVGHRLQRGERFRANDDERRTGIECPRQVSELGAVDIRHAMHPDPRHCMVPKRPQRHDDAEVRSADPDVDDIGKALPPAAANAALVYRVDERAEPVQLGLDLPRHRDTIGPESVRSSAAQRDMQRRPPLGLVDRLAGIHCRARGFHAGFPRQPQQQLPRARRQEIPRIVEQQVARAHRKPFESPVVPGEQPGQRHLRDLFTMMGLERPPRRQVRRVAARDLLHAHILPRDAAGFVPGRQRAAAPGRREPRQTW